jgi:hypothetical protein
MDDDDIDDMNEDLIDGGCDDEMIHSLGWSIEHNVLDPSIVQK